MQTHMRSLRESQHSKSNGSLNQDKTGSARAIEDQSSPRAKYKQRNPTHKGIVRNALAELHLTEFEKRRKQGGRLHKPSPTLTPKITIITPNSKSTCALRDNNETNHKNCTICKRANGAATTISDSISHTDISEGRYQNKYLKRYTIFKDQHNHKKVHPVMDAFLTQVSFQAYSESLMLIVFLGTT